MSKVCESNVKCASFWFGYLLISLESQCTLRAIIQSPERTCAEGFCSQFLSPEAGWNAP